MALGTLGYLPLIFSFVEVVRIVQSLDQVAYEGSDRKTKFAIPDYWGVDSRHLTNSIGVLSVAMYI